MARDFKSQSEKHFSSSFICKTLFFMFCLRAEPIAYIFLGSGFLS